MQIDELNKSLIVWRGRNKKARSQFVWSQCGASFSKWAGRCENCVNGTLVEQVVSSGGSSVVDNRLGAARS